MSRQAELALAEVVRREWSVVVATLVRDTGDLGLAEDATQEAVEAALTTWPTSGVPDRPAAWITTVARRKAIDRLRRERTGRDKTELLGRLEARTVEHEVDEVDLTVVRDDQLRLVFGCCHPALSVEAQVALTLRSIAGLTTNEIARAFLVPEPTMAQRLVRAKKKISAAGIPFVIPPDSELLERLAVVRAVIYLVFNEGYAATSGEQQVRGDLCEESIRLARLLATLISDDAETLGLLALCLLTHARWRARTDRDGNIILLEDQDRALWDQHLIVEGSAVLDRAVRLGDRGPLQVQAAIAALHCQATSAEETDWPAIATLYSALVHMAPTPVTRLNHAVAVAMAQEPAAGLELLDDPELRASLQEYTYFHAARADLLARIGEGEQAVDAYGKALEFVGDGPERRLLSEKRDLLLYESAERGSVVSEP